MTIPLLYCIKKGKYDKNGNRCATQENTIIPLSKTNSGLNSSTNTTSISCRMRYAQTVSQYGYVSSTPSLKLNSTRLGSPTYSY